MKVLLFIALAITLFSCRKTDPLDNPEYIGKWISYDTAAPSLLTANYNGIVLVIDADGSGYDDWSCMAAGDVRITKKFVKIGRNKIGTIDDCHHEHKIIAAPHQVDTFYFDPFDTAYSTIKMTLGVDRGAPLFGYRSTDFYKVQK
jgi:hypothetical protein